LPATLAAIVIRRPRPTRHRRQHLCADKAYRGKPAEAVMRQHGYTPHVRQIGEEAKVKRRADPPAAGSWSAVIRGSIASGNCLSL